MAEQETTDSKWYRIGTDEFISQYTDYIEKALSDSYIESVTKGIDVVKKNAIKAVQARAILNYESTEEISKLETKFVSSDKEKLIFFFDISPDANRIFGIALTNFGVKQIYSREWSILWQDLANIFAFRSGAMKIDIVDKKDAENEEADCDKEINLTQIPALVQDWVLDILNEGCRLFKDIELSKDTNGSIGSIDKEQAVSFFNKNKGAVLLSTGISIITCFSILQGNMTGIDSVLSKIIAVILGFPVGVIVGILGFHLGETIRRWIHPDYIFASGFWGLLKEKIFWKIGPQSIGCLIGVIIGFCPAYLIGKLF
ncbi:MAG: hypothetical protein LBG73_06585 [Spirochaetaceae bacterium]|nr:hypothetical protein [Spirochaetaceae bacterium]